MPSKAPVARFLDPPGLPLGEVELFVGDTSGIDFVAANGLLRDPVDGYVNFPVHWAAGQREQTIIAYVRAKDGTSRTVTLGLERPATTIHVTNDAELSAAIASLTDGGLITLEPGRTWHLGGLTASGGGVAWQDNSPNDWIWIDGRGDATFVGVNNGTFTRVAADEFGFIGCTFDPPSIDQIYTNDGSHMAWVRCDFLAISGAESDDFWLRNGNSWTGQQQYYFDRCRMIGSTLYGFVNAMLVDRCELDEVTGDVFQHSRCVTRSSVTMLYDSDGDLATGHHKDVMQTFWDEENAVFADTVIKAGDAAPPAGPGLGAMPGLQFFFHEGEAFINQSDPAAYPTDPRLGIPRDRYVHANGVYARLQVGQPFDQFTPPASQYWGDWNNWSASDLVVPQYQLFRTRSGFVPYYYNGFSALGPVTFSNCIFAAAATTDLPDGAPWGTPDFPTNVSHSNIGIVDPDWQGSGLAGFVDVTEPFPYTATKAALGIKDPYTPTSGRIWHPTRPYYDAHFDLVTVPGGKSGADCRISAADLEAYINAFVAGNAIADLTTRGARYDDPYYAQPDGIVTAADLSFYVNYYFANYDTGCP